jgi:CysZ protein
MIISAFMKAAEQLLDKSFRKVFLIGVISAILAFAILLYILIATVPTNVTYFDWEWVNDMFSWVLGWSFAPVFIIALYLFFPAVSTVVMGFFLDDIVDAVEAKYYPDDLSPRRLGAYENIMMASKLGLLLVVANILALPLYLMLLITGVGPFILFLVLNSYLIGREYFELVAVRHYPRSAATGIRRHNRDKTFLTGGIITGLYLVPGINLLAPLIGAAMTVHVFHRVKIEAGERDK